LIGTAGGGGCEGRADRKVLVPEDTLLQLM
jgi:hypothetical protein